MDNLEGLEFELVFLKMALTTDLSTCTLQEVVTVSGRSTSALAWISRARDCIGCGLSKCLRHGQCIATS